MSPPTWGKDSDLVEVSIDQYFEFLMTYSELLLHVLELYAESTAITYDQQYSPTSSRDKAFVDSNKVWFTLEM